MTNLKQKFNKVMVMTFALAFMVTGFVSAATTNDGKMSTMYVTDKSLSNNSWSSSVNVDSSEQLSFELHYYLGEGQHADDMKFSMDNLDDMTYDKGQTLTVNGKITSTNLSTSNGNTKVVFDEKVKLHLYNVSWQKWPCQSVGCEESLPDSYRKVLTSAGMSIGDVDGSDSHYSGNVIITYKIEKVEETPTYSDCTLNGVTVDHGDSRRFYSRTHVSYGNSCSNYDLVRSCDDGTLSGSSSYRYATCSVDPEDDDDDEDQGDVDTNSATNIDEDSARLNGDVEDADMDDVWFAFSRTDRTPSCSSSSQRIDARGGSDEGDDFYAYVRNLRENTRYYFRACGENEDGDEVRGSIRSFRTENVEEDDELEEAKVYTNSATNIQKYSAQLNGYVDINDTENGKVYFVYGTSSSYMNKKTSELRVNGNSTFQAITGLNANTRYYFQAIIKDNDGIVDRGIIRNFKTNRAITVANPVNGKCGSYNNACVRGRWVNIRDSATQYKWACNGYNGGRTAICTKNKSTSSTKPPVVISKPIEVIVKNETTVTTTKNYEEKGLKINKWVGKSRTGTFGVETTARKGDTVFYKIKVKNTSDEIVNVKVEDFLPEELNDKDGTTADSDRYMTWVLAMNPGQTKTFIKELVVDSSVDEGDIIDSAAKVTVDDITEDTNEVTIEIVSGEGDNIDGDRNSASFFGANSDFFPTSIFGWLLVLILAFGVLLLGTKVLTVTAKKD